MKQFQLCTFCSYPQHRFSSSHHCHHQSFAIKSVLLPCSIQVDFSIFPLNISQKSFHRPQDICAVRASCTVAEWPGRTSYERCSGTLEARRSFADHQRVDVPNQILVLLSRKGLLEQMLGWGRPQMMLQVRWGLTWEGHESHGEGFDTARIRSFQVHWTCECCPCCPL